MYKVFPQEKTKRLIKKMQKLMKQKYTMSKHQYNRKYNQIMQDLYPILEFVAYTQINKKVQHFNKKVTYYSPIAEGMYKFKDDLILYAIHQMLQYIPKIDTNRKVSNPLFVTQLRSSRKYLYQDLLESKHNDLSIDYYETDDDEVDWLVKYVDAPNILDSQEEKPSFSIFEIDHKKIDDNTSIIFNKILSDFNSRKINSSKFQKYILILTTIQYYLNTITTKKNSIFDNINEKQLKMRNRHDTVSHLSKIINKIYETYISHNNSNKFIYKLNKKTIQEFIVNYLK